MQFQVLGCGDAFSAGGRLHSCYLLEADGSKLLLDCGPSVLPALRGRGIDPLTLDAVVITHLHGDHLGGLPFLDRFIHSQRRRTQPLTLVGPPSLEAAFERLLEALFPGSAGKRSYPVHYLTYPGPVSFGPFELQAYPVHHDPPTEPHAVRLKVGGKVIAFSGDTGWTDVLIDVAREADLFVCECSCNDDPYELHLDLPTLRARRASLTARRMLLTHMGQEVLDLLPLEDFEAAADGLLIDLREK